MNCPSTSAWRPSTGPSPRRGRRAGDGAAAFTMLEMTLALAISSVFMGGIYMTFMQVSKANHRAMTRLEALRGGRAALQTMTNDLRPLNHASNALDFYGVNRPRLSAAGSPYGDGVDDNGNGKIDENVFDGTDDDSLSTTTRTSDVTDRHAILFSSAGTVLYERPMHQAASTAGGNKVDLGDGNVGVDVKFGDDLIRVKTATDAGVSTYTQYGIGTLDGLSNVLLKQVFSSDGSTTTTHSIAPLAFDVLGLDLLYWNSNAATAAEQYWLKSWNSETISTSAPFVLPASVYVRLTLRADPKPEAVTQPGTPVETIVLSTMVNLENVIENTTDFKRPTLP